jgi:pyruvate dehydrogenase E2 component (dihydrolipoamide acetyltransferase)
VIEDADQKTVSQLGLEVKRLASLASTKGLTTEQMSGGTFTISNLGMFGVDQFTAIINPPEGAILAVGNTVREPIVIGDDIVARHRMRYTLGGSSDHRWNHGRSVCTDVYSPDRTTLDHHCLTRFFGIDIFDAVSAQAFRSRTASMC